jgi:hypothetical protein
VFCKLLKNLKFRANIQYQKHLTPKLTGKSYFVLQVPGVMPPFYGNPPADAGFLPGRDRFPAPMWQQQQQQPGAEPAPGWGSPHFQAQPPVVQAPPPHMDFQQPGLYQGYQPAATYVPPFADYGQDQRTAGYVQQQQQFAQRPPSSPAAARFPQQTHTPQPSPNNPTVNGRSLSNGQYLEGSPNSASSGPYVNGGAGYQPEGSMTPGGAPSASPAPPGARHDNYNIHYFNV